jgi:hypothetical protein
MAEKKDEAQKAPKKAKVNPYRNSNIPDDWKCKSCVYLNKETSVPVPKGNCGANDPINKDGCPIYWKDKSES